MENLWVAAEMDSERKMEAVEVIDEKPTGQGMVGQEAEVNFLVA